jgi:hypothetical protein
VIQQVAGFMNSISGIYMTVTFIEWLSSCRKEDAVLLRIETLSSSLIFTLKSWKGEECR